jgi:predicted acetyltransferase
MLELYQHDLSDIWDQDLNSEGEFGYSLNRYWSDPSCAPYVFLVQENFAGFALVDKQSRVPEGDHWMDQFFVMKKYRRIGLGYKAACQVFTLHPGRWQVGQMLENKPAQAFWRKTISSYALGRYEEVHITSGCWKGVIQRFTSPSAA